MNLENIRAALAQPPPIRVLDPKHLSGRLLNETRGLIVMGLYLFDQPIAGIFIFNPFFPMENYIEVYAPAALGGVIKKEIPRISKTKKYPEDDWIFNWVLTRALLEGGYQLTPDTELTYGVI